MLPKRNVGFNYDAKRGCFAYHAEASAGTEDSYNESQCPCLRPSLAVVVEAETGGMLRKTNEKQCVMRSG